MENWKVGKLGPTKLESWNVRPRKIGKLECWKVGVLESWNVGKLGRTKLDSWKVKPKNIGQELESQHISLNMSTRTNTSTHDEYLNCSGIMLFYVLSLIGVLISNQ